MHTQALVSRRSTPAAAIRRRHGRATALDILASSGEIEPIHVKAAERWRRDWLSAMEGIVSDDARSGRAADRHVAMLAHAAASARCRAVARCLGAHAELRLKLLTVDEMSFTEVAQALLPSDTNARKKIAAQFVLLLDILSNYYAAASITKT